MFFSLASIIAQAQPVIESGHLLGVGNTGPVAMSDANVSPGNGGANVTWDLTGLNLTNVGTYKVVIPDSTPYFSTFPSANYCIQLTPAGSTNSVYEYDHVTSGKLEQLATNYSAAGGNNFKANPETQILFPFHYGDSFIDTFVKTTGGPYTVTITYEGYGTLKTPFGVYTNVARIKYDWGPNDYALHWLSTDPQIPILVYSSEDNNYTGIGGVMQTGIKPEKSIIKSSAFPNPFNTKTNILLSQLATGGKLLLTTPEGQIVQTIIIPEKISAIEIDRGNLSAGLYFYRIQENDGSIANGTLLIKD
jgi:hypothetical protein